MNPEIAEILGMCIGDGCISVTKHYNEFAISGDISEERAYYDNWVMPLLNKRIFRPTLGKNLVAKAYPKTGVYGVITFDKRVVERLLQQGLKPSPKINHGIPEQIKNADIEIQRRFLRGLFDTDGSVVFEKNYGAKTIRHSVPRIFIGNVSKNLVDDCIKICGGMGFKVRTRKPWKGKRDKNRVYGLVVYRRRDVKRWFKEIGFKSPKHMTKIALWERNGECPPFTTIEQRLQLLDMVSTSAKLKALA